jgi:hypothetical protein
MGCAAMYVSSFILEHMHAVPFTVPSIQGGYQWYQMRKGMMYMHGKDMTIGYMLMA